MPLSLEGGFAEPRGSHDLDIEWTGGFLDKA